MSSLSSMYLFIWPLQVETGQTVLQAEDKMDDGTPIKLKIEIGDKVKFALHSRHNPLTVMNNYQYLSFVNSYAFLSITLHMHMHTYTHS